MCKLRVKRLIAMCIEPRYLGFDTIRFDPMRRVPFRFDFYLNWFMTFDFEITCSYKLVLDPQVKAVGKGRMIRTY